MLAIRMCLFLVGLFGGASLLVAQCGLEPVASQGVPGVLGSVNTVLEWDPDGAGPNTPKLVVAGNFRLAGTVATGSIALFDPVTGDWSALGVGVDGDVNALAVMPNGDLVAGGNFVYAGNTWARGVARWDGNRWSKFGTGVYWTVHSLAVLQNGDLVAGGRLAGTNGLVRWDGTSWSPLGASVQGIVSSLLVMPNGDLVAGGTFSIAGGVAASRIARWDGATWSPLGAGISATFTSYSVVDLALLPSGDLVAGGRFDLAGGAPAANVARWDGMNWSPMGTGLGFLSSDSVDSLSATPSGELVATGRFRVAGGVVVNSIARWDGTAWQPLGPGLTSDGWAVAQLSTGAVVAGAVGFHGASNARRIALWDGVAWRALGRGFDGFVNCVTVPPSGDVIVGGRFTTAGAIHTNRIARWDGLAWAPLGAGFDHSVTALASHPDGSLYAGGDFFHSGTTMARHVARWDGVSWSPLGSGLNAGGQDTVESIVVRGNQSVVFGGNFGGPIGLNSPNIARWDGAQWHAMAGGVSGRVRAMANLPNGDLVVAGRFQSAGNLPVNNIAVWDGVTWSALGSGVDDVVGALAVLPGGDLVAGGSFQSAGGVGSPGVARWDGTAWVAMSPGPSFSVGALAVLPNGDLLAAGHSSVSPVVGELRRWGGSAWGAVGPSHDGWIRDVVYDPSGELLVVGEFGSGLGRASPFFQRVASSCGAAVVSSGRGCSGTSIPLTLWPSSLPWIGAGYRSDAIGMPPNSVAVNVLGVRTAGIPLGSIVPQAVPGCDLLVEPVALRLHLVTAGVAPIELRIPNNPVAIGLVMHQQAVAAVLSGSTGLGPVTSSNRLTLTIGAY